MLAYKFLEGGRSPFTGWRWELPRAGSDPTWLEVTGPLGLCDNGVHACAPGHLPLWMSDELWRIELDGDVIHTEVALVASRARLLDRVEAWDSAARDAFARYCAGRARRLADREAATAPVAAAVHSAAAGGRTAAAGYWAAVAAGEAAAGRRSGPAYDKAFLAERTAQADWLARRLDLPG